MKISVIMPTYNDANSITETLDTLMMQTYKDWELVIVNDGSQDNTQEVINKYKIEKDVKNQIKYIKQENGDQLNAILNGLQYLQGEYIYVLHSDDLLFSNNVFEKCIEYMEKNEKCDAIMADLTIIDENSNITGIEKVKKYKKKEYILATQLLWLGRNLYVDFAFHRRKSFYEIVKNNYVIWNTPYWINFNTIKPEMLNIDKVNFCLLKYRVHSGNYINNYNGKLNVINGELRTLTSLLNFYNIPAYSVQYVIFRIFNKLRLFSIYRPIFTKSVQKNKGKILEFVIKKRFGNQYTENKFLKALVQFYKNQSNRTIYINDEINNNIVYFGKDNAKFNKLLLSNNLDNIYNYLMEEMEKGFSYITVKNEQEKSKVENIIRFLCINPIVKVVIEEEK